MVAIFFDNVVSIVNAHRNDDLFAQGPLGGHVNMRLGFGYPADNFLNLFNFQSISRHISIDRF